MARPANTIIAVIFAVVSLFWLTACHVVSEEESPNLVPNSGFVIDSDKDGIPDGWDMGTSDVKGIEHSRFGVVSFEGYNSKLLKVVGGQDLAGFWWCTVGSIEPYREYILEFDVIRAASNGRGYPQVELFGYTHTLDQIGLVGRAQHVKLKFHSERNRGETTFRFINNTPVAYHLGRPALRAMRPKQYRLKLDPRPQKTYRQKRLSYFPVAALGGWKDSFEGLGDAGFNCVVVPPDTGIIQRAHQAGLNAAITLPRGKALGKFLKSFKGSGALLHKDDFFILDFRPEMSGITPEELFDARSSLTDLFPDSYTLTSLLRPRFAYEFKDSSDAFIMEAEGGSAPISLIADKVEIASSLVSEDRVYALVDLTTLTIDEARGAAFLALAHGASGLFFRMEEGREPPPGLKGLAARLEHLGQVLQLPAIRDKRPFAAVTSLYMADARGWPAVHTCLRRDGDRWLVIAANGINKPVSAILAALPDEKMEYLKDVETGAKVAIKDRMARVEIGPFEALFLAPPEATKGP